MQLKTKNYSNRVVFCLVFLYNLVMKKVILVFLIIVLIVVLGLFLKPIRQDILVEYKKTDVILGQEVFSAQIADNDVLRELGLSYRKNLGERDAMLFVFEKPSIQKFWMKDMNFPIDIIWLNEQKKIVHIEKSVKPDTFPDSFGPKQDVLYVIEVGSMVSDSLGLSLGDTVSFDI